jgi:hypothetical protein
MKLNSLFFSCLFSIFLNLQGRNDAPQHDNSFKLESNFILRFSLIRTCVGVPKGAVLAGSTLLVVPDSFVVDVDVVVVVDDTVIGVVVDNDDDDTVIGVVDNDDDGTVIVDVVVVAAVGSRSSLFAPVAALVRFSLFELAVALVVVLDASLLFCLLPG